ncbi:MAG: sigma-70 family RNA polymerase sigma factor [Verrucomicrobia bacterium]|nr:sigma-70 family RNA polymerase sigma factor [Verrucomicrobiota bacterium]
MKMGPEITPIDFNRLFAEQRENVRQLLARMVPAAEVDDLLQDVFVKASRALPSFRGEAGAGTWLFQIARNTALDHLRSRRHREVGQTVSLSPVDDDESDNAPLVPDLIESAVAPAKLERREMHGCIREYVERLSPDHRQVIELKDLAGLTNAEISTRLGISLDAAKIRLHRARTALRQLLSDGCELYQSDTGTLACDRRQAAPVSLSAAISSKEVQPEAGARCAESTGLNSNDKNDMSSSSSSCGCAAPETCASPASAVSLFTPIAAEFVALGAAIGANCEPCLRFHTREAEKLGISKADIAKAIAMAAKVKETPAANILKLAERLTQPGSETSEPATPGGCGCSA